jgi:plasmid stabilization system protein ParE
MRYQVEINFTGGHADLAEIVSYIAKDDPLTAEAFGMELLDQVLMLSTLPYRGARMRRNPRARKLVLGLPLCRFSYLCWNLTIIEIFRWRFHYSGYPLIHRRSE